MIRKMDPIAEVGSPLPLWEVDMPALFAHCRYSLEAHEVIALAEWIEMVCGGTADRADDLRSAVADQRTIDQELQDATEDALAEREEG